MLAAIMAALEAIAAMPAIFKEIAQAQQSNRLASLEAQNQELTKAVIALGSAQTLDERRAAIVNLSKASNS